MNLIPSILTPIQLHAARSVEIANKSTNAILSELEANARHWWVECPDIAAHLETLGPLAGPMCAAFGALVDAAAAVAQGNPELEGRIAALRGMVPNLEVHEDGSVTLEEGE